MLNNVLVTLRERLENLTFKAYYADIIKLKSLFCKTLSISLNSLSYLKLVQKILFKLVLDFCVPSQTVYQSIESNIKKQTLVSVAIIIKFCTARVNTQTHVIVFLWYYYSMGNPTFSLHFLNDVHVLEFLNIYGTRCNGYYITG